MTVHGNTIISAGDIVKVNLPPHSSFDIKDSKGVDKFYQGPFLVKTIRHDFMFTNNPPKHQMMMNLVKDSFETELEAPVDNIEPNSHGGASLEDYDYF
jgi:hypothetical protein